MSDMTIEEARKITAECGSEVCSDGNCFAAKFFSLGHASRDPEVAELNGKLEAAWKQVDTFDRGMRKTLAELSAEREAPPGHSPEGKTL